MQDRAGLWSEVNVPSRADVAGRTGLQPWQKRGVHGAPLSAAEGRHMDAIIYLVGLVVVVMAILSFFGLR
jgi:hypothetical protein